MENFTAPEPEHGGDHERDGIGDGVKFTGREHSSSPNGECRIGLVPHVQSNVA